MGKDLFGVEQIDDSKNVHVTKNAKSKVKKDLSATIETRHVIEIVCKDAVEQEKMYNKLIERGFTCQILTL